MKTSCGVIILNEEGELLMGHVTGQKFHDIPKGLLETGEEPVVCAIRETQEEMGLKLDALKLQDIGLLPYNREKNLHLFIYPVHKSTVDLEKLECNSFFEHFYTKKPTPEVDSFQWVPLSEIESYSAKSMSKLLLKLQRDGLLNFK